MKNTFRTTPVAFALACLAGSALAQNTPIRIGVVTPLSGTYAGIGQQVKWGLDLAARQINAAGGVAGRPLELIYEDEEANPAVAVQKAEKLFQVNKVDFLTGTVNSGATLAVGQVAERNNRLIATTVSFADSITGDKCSPNVFRVNARAGMQSAALADWMASTRPNANVFYLGPDYEMGRSTVAAFKSAAEAKGAKSVGEVFAPLPAALLRLHRPLRRFAHEQPQRAIRQQPAIGQQNAHLAQPTHRGLHCLGFHWLGVPSRLCAGGGQRFFPQTGHGAV